MVIAPTRAACETIELGVGVRDVETVLEREHGEDVRRLAGSGKGFGIVAGTGTGKTLAIRPIAEEIVGLPLRVGVVNREREATPETPNWNVVIITTGIARRWLQDDLIGAEDTLIVDEIHQTSAELELCLALGKRAGCRLIWLSATVDPAFYSAYLNSAEVIESSAFDPAMAAKVGVIATTNPLNFLGDRFLRRVVKEKRGVAVFVPTRAETEQVAEKIGEQWDRIYTEFYHGGEPITKLRPFLEGDAPHPYMLSMTAAGQSALNIRGLDTVVIEDARFTSLVRHGKGVLTRLPLGANEILQMAGRVHGRVPGGEVWILSDRDIDFGSLQPTPPNFQLAGDPERVAMTCADVGVRADELDLPVPLDRVAYRRAVDLLTRRGLIVRDRLTEYGRKVEVLPVDRPWGELLVNADDHLIPLVSVCASIESLHRMTRQDRYIGAYIVPGTDHLTAYNLYEDALRSCGSLGKVYGLPRHVFDADTLGEWAADRGVLVRSIEDAALALASIYRSLELDLPRTVPRLNDELIEQWQRLLARAMPFDVVIDEETSWGEQIRVAQSSVCGRWGAVVGDVRYFSDRFGRTRGSIEGTQIPYEMIWQDATVEEAEVVYDPGHPRAPLRLRSSREYHGFELDAEEVAIDRFPVDQADAARRALAEAMAAGAAYHRDIRGNQAVFRELREVYRRSGGATAEASESALADYFEEKLAGIGSLSEFADADLKLAVDDFVPRAERRRWLSLPDAITLAGGAYPLDYAIEGGEAIVRARIPEKVLRQLTEADVPVLDRPLHWTVLRGKKGAVKAATLESARELASLTKAQLLDRATIESDGGDNKDRGARRDRPEARGDTGTTRSNGDRRGARGAGATSERKGGASEPKKGSRGGDRRGKSGRRRRPRRPGGRG
ncbi:MAG: DEAD/DEAH box helicase [Gemmatimonas sp.]|nr:DEAD/DEAH box helicase [Gemmatimonas sp.]